MDPLFDFSHKVILITGDDECIVVNDGLVI